MSNEVIIFTGVGIYLAIMLVVTPLTQQFDPPRPALNSDGEEIELTNRLGTLPLFRRV